MLRIACLLALFFTSTAFAAVQETNLDRACVTTLRAARFGLTAARSLCYQYRPEEQDCIVRTFSRTRDWRHVSYVCLHVHPDGKGPYPWVPRGGYCYDFPSDIYCQSPGFRFGWHHPW